MKQSRLSAPFLGLAIFAVMLTFSYQNCADNGGTGGGFNLPGNNDNSSQSPGPDISKVSIQTADPQGTNFQFAPGSSPNFQITVVNGNDLGLNYKVRATTTVSGSATNEIFFGPDTTLGNDSKSHTYKLLNLTPNASDVVVELFALQPNGMFYWSKDSTVRIAIPTGGAPTPTPTPTPIPTDAEITVDATVANYAFNAPADITVTVTNSGKGVFPTSDLQASLHLSNNTNVLPAGIFGGRIGPGTLNAKYHVDNMPALAQGINYALYYKGRLVKSGYKTFVVTGLQSCSAVALGRQFTLTATCVSPYVIYGGATSEEQATSNKCCIRP